MKKLNKKTIIISIIIIFIIGIYYLFSNILGVIQQEIINKFVLKKGKKKEEILALGKGGK